jgi:hypothetical protein
MNAPIEWLLEGDPWIEFRTRVDLLGQPESDEVVQSARRAMLQDVKLDAVLTDLTGWPGAVISSHKSAGQPFHKLTFIADLGLKAGDPAVAHIIPRILEHQSAEGPFQLPTNVPKHYGGSGEDEWAWALCDAPLLVYALIQFGLEDEPAVRSAVEYLIELVRANGWPCAVSKELGKFRGPGRKEDPCPFANLAMLKALAVSANRRDSDASRTGAETLLTLWNESAERHPYMFFMGTDFRKLKVPLVWYDLVHVLDVLSRFPWLAQDARLRDMLALLKSKADSEGRFTLESVWTAWKDWEFGQKREPSRWLTLLAWRIIRRVEGA